MRRYADKAGPESEMDWRSAPAWKVEGFFEVLKGLFRRLDFCPSSEYGVLDRFSTYLGKRKGIVEATEDVWRKYGWPEKAGDGFDKEAALEDVKKMLEERFGIKP